MADRIITQFMRYAGRLCGRDGHDPQHGYKEERKTKKPAVSPSAFL